MAGAFAQQKGLCTANWIKGTSSKATKQAAGFSYEGNSTASGVNYSGGFQLVNGKKHAIVSNTSDGHVSLQRGQSWGNGPAKSYDPRSLEDELYSACANAFPDQFNLPKNYPGSIYTKRSASSVEDYSVSVFDTKTRVSDGLKVNLASGKNKIEYVFGQSSLTINYSRSGALGGGLVRTIN